MLAPLRFDSREWSGAFGDIGVLAPLAITLVSANGLSPTAVFGVAGLVYIAAGAYYRVPVPVQPLKSLSALAIGLGLGPAVIGAAGLWMGALLLTAAATGIADRMDRLFTREIVRGIQLGVGLILAKKGIEMILAPVPIPALGSFRIPAMGISLAVLTAGLMVALRKSDRVPAGLAVLALGIGAGLLIQGLPEIGWGPAAVSWTVPTAETSWQAFFLLVLPQIPLTLTNSVVAATDVARTYYGDAARRVTGRAVATGLGLANIAAGAVGGVPVCHGSGGFTAHHRLGARTGGASVLIGAVLLVLAFGCGPSVAALCALIPAPVLGTLLIAVGGAHALLVRDVAGTYEKAVVVAMGTTSLVTSHNGYGLGVGAALLGARWAVRRAGPLQDGGSRRPPRSGS